MLKTALLTLCLCGAQSAFAHDSASSDSQLDWGAEQDSAGTAPEQASSDLATQPTEVPALSRGSRKKGLGMWGTAGKEGAQVGAHWYYNWYPAPTMGNSGDLEFVPMIWTTRGDRGPTPANLAKAKAAASPNLLGFNEPDNTGLGGTDVSVASALEAWPLLMATGKRHGSPAVASNYVWLDQFMIEARNRGYRIDFITMHHYPDVTRPDAAVQRLKDIANWLHDRYHLPIWVTEFGACTYSGGWPNDGQVRSFAWKAVTMFESLGFVERYAWFSDKGYSGCEPSSIWNNWGLSAAGQAYRDVGY